MAPTGGWQVEFYLDARGRNPVLEFIYTLQPKERATVNKARRRPLLKLRPPVTG